MISDKHLYAGIDLGSNSVRLLIGYFDDGWLRPVAKLLNITRMGKDFYDSAIISEDPWEKTIDTLKNYSDTIKEHNASHAAVFATGVMRSAKNADDFIADVYEKTGLNVQVISGETEARLTALGVVSAVSAEKGIIFDVGGGSTEFIVTKGDEITAAHSIDIGAVTLYEAFIKSDPPFSAELTAMNDYIKRTLYPLKETLHNDASGGHTLIFTAGTATTLAAIKLRMSVYDADTVNNTLISSDEVKAMYDDFVSKEKLSRAQIIGLEKGREDIIISGTAIALNVMEIFNKDKITISDAGLLEGIVIDLCKRADDRLP